MGQNPINFTRAIVKPSYLLAIGNVDYLPGSSARNTLGRGFAGTCWYDRPDGTKGLPVGSLWLLGCDCDSCIKKNKNASALADFPVSTLKKQTEQGSVRANRICPTECGAVK